MLPRIPGKSKLYIYYNLSINQVVHPIAMMVNHTIMKPEASVLIHVYNFLLNRYSKEYLTKFPL